MTDKDTDTTEEMNNEEPNDANEEIKDLEPKDDVKGGYGKTYY